MYMKYIFIVAIAVFSLVGVAEAGKELIRGTNFATVGLGNEVITVSKVEDGETTCYITRHGKFGAHDISCVK